MKKLWKKYKEAPNDIKWYIRILLFIILPVLIVLWPLGLMMLCVGFFTLGSISIIEVISYFRCKRDWLCDHANHR